MLYDGKLAFTEHSESVPGIPTPGVWGRPNYDLQMGKGVAKRRNLSKVVWAVNGKAGNKPQVSPDTSSKPVPTVPFPAWLSSGTLTPF